MIQQLLTRLRPNSTPPTLVPYRGFANSERFFLQGRVLEFNGISVEKNQSRLRRFMNNLRRIKSDEIPKAKIVLQLSDTEHHTESDHEGYFNLSLEWPSAPIPPEGQWITGAVRFSESPLAGLLPMEASPVEILYPSAKASFGIISDIDDTVLQTFVTSRFKLKMLYATLFEDSQRRLPMEGMPALLHDLERGADGQRLNPIFYVSDSPWNLYDMLAHFMDFHKLPKGPILLRDYGLQMLWPRKGQPVHKLDALRQILGMYPGLSFVMLGDTASMDADYYLKMAEEFPGQVLAIYIRKTRNNANARRIAKLLKEQTLAHAIVVKTSAEMQVDMRERGLLAG
jgi:phosphatidate phosphatase APP1